MYTTAGDQQLCMRVIRRPQKYKNYYNNDVHRCQTIANDIQAVHSYLLAARLKPPFKVEDICKVSVVL